MNLEELRLLRLVQGILVRNYVDTQRLEVEVIGTSVYVAGEFRVFEYHPSQKKEDKVERDLGIRRTLLHIEQQIRGLAEVSYLEMKLQIGDLGKAANLLLDVEQCAPNAEIALDLVFLFLGGMVLEDAELTRN